LDGTADITLSTTIEDAVISNVHIADNAAILDTKLSTISTAGKVLNSATTATASNTVDAIVARDANGNFTAGTITADLQGNADTATQWETARNVALQGPITAIAASLDGTADITLSTTIEDAVISNVHIANDAAILDTKLDTISTVGKVLNSATTATASNTADAIVARDASGNFTAGTITANLQGNADTATQWETARNVALQGPITATAVSLDGTADIALTTTIENAVISNVHIADNAAILDTKLNTISTVGKVLNSATTATEVNTPDAIVARDASGNFTAGTITADLQGNADTATQWETARNVALQGPITATAVSLDGTADIALTTAIEPAVISNVHIANDAAILDTKLSTISTVGKVLNSATTATASNTADAIVARDASGNFTAGTITADLQGNADTATQWETARGVALQGPITAIAASLDGTADITLSTTIEDAVISNVHIANDAAILDTKLDTISTAGKVLNSATTATASNTADAIVARDASGNFTAGTITAALAGNASSASKWQTARTLTIGNTGKTIDGSTNVAWTLSDIGALPLTGGTLTGNLEIAGNLTISGTTTEVATETLTVNDNIIVVNSNLETAPPSILKSGIEVNRGTESNFQFVFEEQSQFFKVGTVDDLQAVATRPDEVPAQAIAFWDDAQKSLAFRDTVVVTATGNVGIGTTTPGEKLDVVGNVRASSQLISTVATGTAPLAVTSTTEVTNLNAALLGGEAKTYYLNVDNATDGTLAVARGGTGQTSLTANKILVGNDISGILQPTNLHWDNANSRLGIGTTTPSRSLHVNGDLEVNDAYVNGTIKFGSFEVRLGQNTGTGVVVRADTNPPINSTIFAVESSGPATRFGVTQDNGTFARDGFVVGVFDNGVISGTPLFQVDGSGTMVHGTVPWARLSGYPAITAGDGLSGGGDLSDTRTLDVDSTVVRTSGNQTLAGVKTFSSTIVGSVSGNAGTATTWQTARTLTIGNSGKSVNGGAAVSWTLDEIGAAARTRNIATGTGLSGGGDLTQDRTLSVDATVLRTSGNFTMAGNLSFGSTTRQMLNLWSTSYGIGVQSNTLYYRTADHFAWFRNGSHSDTIFNSGGGATMMVLNSSGRLGIGTTAPGSLLSVAGSGSMGAGYATTTAPTNGLIVEGNVGIGTAAPSFKLDVQGDVRATSRVTAETYNLPGVSASTESTGLFWALSANYGIYRSSGSWTSPSFQQLVTKWITGIILDPGTQYGKSYVDIQGNGLRVTSGNVGIGTTAPGSLLAVANNASVGSGYATTAAPENGLIIQGNVGIGTSNPVTVGGSEIKLDVRGDIYLGGTGRNILTFTSGNMAINTANTTKVIFTNPIPMNFKCMITNLRDSSNQETTTLEEFHVTWRGNDAEPIISDRCYKRTGPNVYGLSKSRFFFDANSKSFTILIARPGSGGSANAFITLIGLFNTPTAVDVDTSDPVGNEILTINGTDAEFGTFNISGNVGIGVTNPSQRLQVEGNVALSGAARFVGTTTNHNLAIRTNNTDRVTVTAAGNVGIGTTAPGETLDAVGFIQSSQGYKVTGSTIINSSGEWTNGDPSGNRYYTTTNVANGQVASTGTWTVNATTTTWAPGYHINDVGNAFADAPATRDFAVPSGMSHLYINHLTWSSGGYFDVFGLVGTTWILCTRISSFQNAQNTNISGEHAGVSITEVGGINRFSQIRIDVRNGRTHLMGLGWSKTTNGVTNGGQSGFVHWDNVHAKPSFLLTSGGTMTGVLNMNNQNITNANHITIADPGVNEGIEWLGGNGWKIYESPDAGGNNPGNLQFVRGSHDRHMTLNTSGDLFVKRNVDITAGALSFGSTTRQMLNLFNTGYGIGVQGGTQYYRTEFNFAWFRGGSHNNTAFNSGGGTTMMVLNSSGRLGIGTTAPGEILDAVGFIQSSQGYKVAGSTVVDSATNVTCASVTSTGDIVTDGAIESGLGYRVGDLEVIDSSGNFIAGSLRIQDAQGSPVLFVDDGGQVGIGTSTPASTLAVAGNGSVGSGYATTAAPTDGLIVEGNVGIGTTSPLHKLECMTAIGSDTSVSITAGGELNQAILYLGTPFNGTVSGRKVALIASGGTGWSTSPLHFCLNNSTGTGTNENSATISDARMTILPGGNVGIGTTAPGEKLQVQGNLRVGGSSTENYIAFHGTTFDGSGSFNHTYIGERIYGGSESSELLLFKGNDPDTSSAGPDRIRLAAAQIVLDTYAAGSVTTSGTFNTVATSTSVATRMIITGAGNVGIGTTNPSQKLQVEGNVALSGAARFVGTTTNHDLSIRTNNTDRVTVTAGGNVGIGTTSPATTLHVTGKATIHTGAIGAPANGTYGGNDGTRLILWPGSSTVTPYALGINNSMLWYTVPSTAVHAWYTGTAERMRLTSAGILAIGTTAPDTTVKLHVEGDIYASGEITGLSDRNLKTHLEPLTSVLARIQGMRGYTFEFKADSDRKKHIGLVAQEVESEFPELVRTDPSNGTKKLAYSNFTAVLLEAVRELSKENDALKRDLRSLREDLDAVMARIG
jgi:hypothetical protein